MHIARQRGDKSRSDDVALRSRRSTREERGGHGAQDHDEQDERSDRPAAIPEQSRHVAALRTRGSSHAAKRSASMLPATTSTALTAVAAMTTG